MTGAMQLVIGNKNYSSWSLRPWLVMQHFGIAFEEVRVNLRAPDRKAQILAHSAAGTVPALKQQDLIIGDSLAICEYLGDLHPDKGLWPRDLRARAVARAISAEMHSGFAPLRAHCPMDMIARTPMSNLPDDVGSNVTRIVEIWKNCRKEFGAGGDMLFGEFSIADAMYAPVASRFRTYVPDLSQYGDDGTAQAYVEAVHSLPAIERWIEEGRREIVQYG